MVSAHLRSFDALAFTAEDGQPQNRHASPVLGSLVHPPPTSAVPQSPAPGSLIGAVRLFALRLPAL